MLNNTEDFFKKSSLKAILLAGLLAGISDGIAATIQYALSGAESPIRIFNFVASGVFGEAALSGGGIMTLSGIVFHLLIATIWAAIYFIIYPVVRKVSRNWLATGLIYGTIVWTCMNLIVLPLSNTPPRTLTVDGIIAGMLIIMIFVGLPIAYFANKFFSKKNSPANIP